MGSDANDSVDVAQEIIDVLMVTRKHEILLLSRKVRTSSTPLPTTDQTYLT